jgi:hypothetical protein
MVAVEELDPILLECLGAVGGADPDIPCLLLASMQSNSPSVMITVEPGGAATNRSAPYNRAAPDPAQFKVLGVFLELCILMLTRVLPIGPGTYTGMVFRSRPTSQPISNLAILSSVRPRLSLGTG